MPIMLPFTRRELTASVALSLVVLLVSAAAVQWAGRFALPIIAAGGFFALVAVALLVQRRIEDRIDDARGLTEAAFALYHVLKPVTPLPLLRDYALAPDSALLLHKLVRAQTPQLVIETGSGVSTLVIGYTLKALGAGRLISLELNEDYARRTREEVARHGLTEWVTVAHAPLTETTVDGHTYRWHDLGALDAALAGASTKIDLVFDDGPPLYLGRSLRYAAMPLLAPRLAADATYCINYVAAEERANVARWLERDPLLSAEWHRTRKGNVVLRRAAATAARELSSVSNVIASGTGPLLAAMPVGKQAGSQVSVR
jgi:hypothetical protein